MGLNQGKLFKRYKGGSLFQWYRKRKRRDDDAPTSPPTPGTGTKEEQFQTLYQQRGGQPTFTTPFGTFLNT